MSNRSNEEKISRIIKYWFESGKNIKDCIVIVEPDIKEEVLERIFSNYQKRKQVQS